MAAACGSAAAASWCLARRRWLVQACCCCSSTLPHGMLDHRHTGIQRCHAAHQQARAQPHTSHSPLQAYGMMGWRVGYIAYPEAAAGGGGLLGQQLLKVQDTIPICPSQLSQHVALEALTAGQEYVQQQVGLAGGAAEQRAGRDSMSTARAAPAASGQAGCAAATVHSLPHHCLQPCAALAPHCGAATCCPDTLQYMACSPNWPAAPLPHTDPRPGRQPGGHPGRAVPPGAAWSGRGRRRGRHLLLGPPA
jgi:hypothetical protein